MKYAAAILLVTLLAVITATAASGDADAAAAMFPEGAALQRKWLAADSNQLVRLRTDFALPAPPGYLEFYEARIDGILRGRAVIHSEKGKHGTIRVMVALAPDHSVLQVRILSHKERRGRNITKDAFTSQFSGMTSKSRFRLGETIHGITGATVSSKAVAQAVRLVAVYTSVVLAKPALR